MATLRPCTVIFRRQQTDLWYNNIILPKLTVVSIAGKLLLFTFYREKWRMDTLFYIAVCKNRWTQKLKLIAQDLLWFPWDNAPWFWPEQLSAPLQSAGLENQYKIARDEWLPVQVFIEAAIP